MYMYPPLVKQVQLLGTMTIQQSICPGSETDPTTSCTQANESLPLQSEEPTFAGLTGQMSDTGTLYI